MDAKRIEERLNSLRHMEYDSEVGKEIERLENLKSMDSLTKENFWNRMMEAYPSEMDRFCKWIDGYKERVDWNLLFGANIADSFVDEDEQVQKFWRVSKYHEIPLAMQIGIFFQFVVEQSGTDSHDSIFGDINSMGEFASEIEQYFNDCLTFTRREQNEG